MSKAFVIMMVCSLAMPVASLETWGEDWDVLITGGRVVDGTGNPSFRADVAVKHGRVAAVGRQLGTARTKLDATGLIVCPGFIDVHTHADEVAEMPLAENFVRMGVTTIVVGNCGGSALNISRFFAEVEATNVAVNVATLIGHNTVRSKAMGGDFDRPPTTAELSIMKDLVSQGMKDGAVGLSTGLIYLPGVFSRSEEIIELAKMIAPLDGIYTSHMRHEDTRIYEALDEVFRISREAQVRAEVSHIKLSGPTAWGQSTQVLNHIQRARDDGVDVTQDQYVYTASSTGISQLIPESARDGGNPKFVQRLADPVQKAAIVNEMKRMLQQKGRHDYSYAVIAFYRKDPALNGLNIVEAAKLTRDSDSLEDQIELVLDIQKNGGASGVFHGMSEDDLITFLRHPNTMIACDSGLRTFGAGVPHPRGYGNNARVLAKYVRDLKILRLEDAIRKMTSLPANTFRFSERGLLQNGYWADIVVFNPTTIQDTATFKAPHQYPQGIRYVLVNGVLVLEGNRHTAAKAGRALRHLR